MTSFLDDAAIERALADLPGWVRSGDAIRRVYRFGDFPEAFSFLTRVAFAAEAAGHHPEIHHVYSTVTLTLCTHDAGGRVTEKDLDLARAIERFNWTGRD